MFLLCTFTNTPYRQLSFILINNFRPFNKFGGSQPFANDGKFPLNVVSEFNPQGKLIDLIPQGNCSTGVHVRIWH